MTLAFSLAQDLASENPSVLESEAALALIEQFDIRAACMHLICSAYATQLDCLWKDQFGKKQAAEFWEVMQRDRVFFLIKACLFASQGRCGINFLV